MILLEGVTARAGGFVLGPVDLRLAAGEYFVLLGPSGAGKTLLLEAIAGLRPFTAGRMLIDGEDAAPIAPERRGTGFVYQDYMLFPGLTVAGNIAFGLGPAALPKLLGTAGRRIVGRGPRPAGDPRVQELAELVGVGDLLDRSPRTLSGGEQQRVALARALITRPRLLLLDEPLSALDADTREGLQDVLKRIHERFPTTVLHVTHSFSEATVLADRCAVLDRGRLRQIGTPSEVFRRPVDRFVAGFTGGRNVFSARAEAAGEGSLVTLDGGLTLRSHSSPAAIGSLGLQPGPVAGRVGVLIRPEDISVGGSGAQPGAAPGAGQNGNRAARRAGSCAPEPLLNTIDGIVAEIVDQGATAFVRVDVPPTLTALLMRREADAIAVGDRVRLSFPSQAVHLFEPEE